MRIEDFGNWTSNGRNVSGADVTIQAVITSDKRQVCEITVRNGKAKLFKSGRISVLPIIAMMLIKDDENGTKLSQVSAQTSRTRISDPDVWEWAKRRAGDYNLRYAPKEEVFYINATKPDEIGL